MKKRAVIIGAGQAGAQGAQSMRQAGFDGEIVMIGDEPALPYQRPPLSKAYLKGELDADRLYLRPQKFFDELEIQLRLSERVIRIDRDAKSVFTATGEEFAYDSLLLATGAPPRKLMVPGADLRNIFYLRTLQDSDNLRAILSGDGRVVIVGAGYIGLEVAAVARAAGCEVTVLEIAERVLARVACEEVSHFYEDLHRTQGVDIQLASGLDHFVGDGDAVCGVVLSSGEEIDASSVLVGVGAAPEIALANEAALKLENGIWVDDHARTSDPSIWAAGDCTNFPSLQYGRRMRLESVPNAIEQAKVAGANIAGADKIYDAVPWFWSDQYDVKLQTVGIAEGADGLVLRGHPEEKKFSAWHFNGDDLLAVDAINEPIAFAVAKKALMTKTPIDREKLADLTVDMKTLLS